ncbi:TetR family transcriptional regulator [Nonomuraea soli]|uniref:AcrR family transcriptional regulator n=1 Tax=Nonomuraea soli TaxID=1032476 RepID=A0A7W0CJE5_9ACTN|nr:TetR family transcriptional regulator [Nonomuraea soli]MBA2892218.1 AcrR family transcriptional regulator [Nonomuraea soli]
MSTARRPGRRPGAADTRGEILTAARKVFSEKGYDKATMRGIAREAGVDPALVHHYFANKEGVFAEALQLPVTPDVILPELLGAPRHELGERLVRLLLTVTSDPQAREPVIALMRSAMTNDQARETLREFMSSAMLFRVADALEVPHIRIEAAFAQMFGIIMARYVLRLEPIASADLEEIVELVGPTLQRYLDP